MRIEIDKKRIPYIFTLKSGSEVYLLKIKHFKENNRIYIDIMNEDGDILLKNEKLVYGRAVGSFMITDDNNNVNQDFLNCFIVPLSADRRAVPITLENFCETIFLEFFLIESDVEDE